MKTILQNAGLTELERLAVSALCDGPQCAESLAEILSLPHYVMASRAVGRAGHKVYDATPETSHVRNWHPKNWGARGWYHVIAPGRRFEVQGQFYWELRQEVKEAFKLLRWYAPLQTPTRKIPSFEPQLEGAEVRRLLSIYERDPQLRADCLRIHGFACSICGCIMESIYGDLGKEFIHVHHIRPLAAKEGERKTDPKKDLIPVCPNCHAMIHRGGLTRTPQDVKRALNAATKSGQGDELRRGTGHWPATS